jgi:hypothetical protein
MTQSAPNFFCSARFFDLIFYIDVVSEVPMFALTLVLIVPANAYRPEALEGLSGYGNDAFCHTGRTRSGSMPSFLATFLYPGSYYPFFASSWMSLLFPYEHEDKPFADSGSSV